MKTKRFYFKVPVIESKLESVADKKSNCVSRNDKPLEQKSSIRSDLKENKSNNLNNLNDSNLTLKNQESIKPQTKTNELEQLDKWDPAGEHYESIRNSYGFNEQSYEAHNFGYGEQIFHCF